MSPAEPAPPAARPPRLRLLVLWVLPLLMLGPSLLPGRRFLPQLPVMLAPLSVEAPEAAERAARGANLVASDALFPLLGDELAIREQLAELRLPLWSPHQGLGSPLAAGSMAAPWNPLRWPFLWMAPDVARGWHALLALFLAGLGMLWFLERRVSTAAALVGALAVQVGGFGYANLHYLPKLDAALWLPWCLWAVDAALREGSRRAEWVLFAALASSALAGFPPIFVFVTLLAALWFLTRARGAPPRRVARVAAFAALGVLAGAVHLVPMATLAASSTRGVQSLEQVESGALAPAALCGLVSPEVFGEAEDSLPASRHPVAWWLSREGRSTEILNANRLEWSLYAGVAILVLALAALGASWRAWVFPAAALLACLGFQFGVPGARELYALPGLDLGSPARVGALTWFLWPWLAAVGYEALLRRGRAALAVGATAASSLCAGALWLARRPIEPTWPADLEWELAKRHGVSLQEVEGYFTQADTLRAFGELSGSATVLAILAGASLLLVGVAPWSRRALITALLCGLIGVDGLMASRGWTRPRSLAPGEQLWPTSPALEAVSTAAGDGRVVRVDTSASGIDEVLDLARPNLLPAYGIRDLTPYVALPDGELVAALEGLDPEGRYRSGWSALSDPRLVDAELLDELHVTCVLSKVPLESERLELVHEQQDFHVYRREAPARARFRAEDAEVTNASVELLRDEPGEMVWRVRTDRAGALLVSERASSDWRVTVDGAAGRWSGSDPFHLAVSLGPGDHTVELVYVPGSFRLGVLTSLASVLCALAWVGFGAHGSRKAAARGILPADAPPDPR